MYGTRCRRILQFYLHTHTFFHKWNEPLPFLQPKPDRMALRDGKLCWPRHHHGEYKQSAQDRYVQLSQLLAAQAVAPYWATGVQRSVEPATSRAANYEANH